MPLAPPPRRRAPVADAAEPFERVMSLDRRHARVAPWLGLTAAVCVHAVAAVAGAAHFSSMADALSTGPLVAELWQEHAVDLEPPAPPPATPDTQPDAPAEPGSHATPPPSEPRAPTAATTAAEPPPLPAAAQAGALLTAEPNPNEPLDLTGGGFVTGTSERYAGGVTAALGTATTAVRNPNAHPGGVFGGRSRGPAVVSTSRQPRSAGRDRSRPARPLSTNWDCGFPAAANTAQVNFARVRLVVTVGADGRARSVAVHSDPGHGFGAMAQRCAHRYSFQVGHDSHGRPVASTTPPFWVTFTR